MRMKLPLTKSFTVPPQAHAVVRFAFDAMWENAIIIYSDDYIRVVERGNYDRSTAEWDSGRNTSGRAITYIVSGWHKEGEPNGTLPWLQSRSRLLSESSNEMSIGFDDDGGDDDFNDAIATVSIRY